MTGDFDELVLAQGGVFTRRQALAAGFAPEQVRRRLAGGSWVALTRGIYTDRVGAALAGQDAGARHLLDAAAARLAAGPTAVLSHETAALAHGAAVLTTPARARLTLPRGGPRRALPGNPAQVSWASLPPHHVVATPFGPATSPARTVIDLARATAFEAAVVTADSALHLRLCRRTDLAGVAESCRGWPGIAAARDVLRFADPAAESPLESVSRVRLHSQGLPEPELQRWVHDGDGLIGRVDFLWWEQRVVGEADGRVKYETQADLWREKRRQERLERAGFVVVRWSWAEIVHAPEAVAARIRAAFVEAAARRVA